MGLGAEGPPGGRGGRGGRRPAPGYDEGWARPGGAPRPRSAVHDPWRPRRQLGFPGGMPRPSMLLGGTMVVLFAFLLGRCTAGGDPEVSTVGPTTTVPTLTTTTVGIMTLHTVAENETLASIASRYGVTINDIAIANNLGDLNHIQVGQQLKIPAPTPVTVAPATTTTTKKKKG
jgi:LysM domain